MEIVRKLYVLSTTLILKPELKEKIKKQAQTVSVMKFFLHEDYSVVLTGSILGW